MLGKFLLMVCLARHGRGNSSHFETTVDRNIDYDAQLLRSAAVMKGLKQDQSSFRPFPDEVESTQNETVR